MPRGYDRDAGQEERLMPSTGAEPVDTLHITYLVSDDGKQAIEFDEPMVVVLGPGSAGATYAEVEADFDALTEGVDKLSCANAVRQKFLGWKLEDAACEPQEQKLKAKVVARATAVKPDPKRTATIDIACSSTRYGGEARPETHRHD